MLDSLGIEVPSDLRFIYVEDLIEEGISYVEAIKLLQGYQSSGAIRPFYPITSELRALPVKIHGRFGAIRSRPWRGRRAQPAQSDNPEAASSSTAPCRNEPASSTTLNWSQPRPFHEVFRQQEAPSINNLVWIEGVKYDALVHPSIGTVLDAPKLQPLMDSGGVSSIARATRPSVEMASVTSPREEEEYQKVREREEQLDDQWLTSMMVNQPPESRGPIRGCRYG